MPIMNLLRRNQENSPIHNGFKKIKICRDKFKEVNKLYNKYYKILMQETHTHKNGKPSHMYRLEELILLKCL
jgi:hypothetical protein